jgi:hypothetical protein
MIDCWVDPEGPYAHLSQLMMDKWANANSVYQLGWADPEGPFTHMSQTMKDKWTDVNGVYQLGWADLNSNYWKGRESASSKKMSLN